MLILLICRISLNETNIPHNLSYLFYGSVIINYVCDDLFRIQIINCAEGKNSFLK